MLENQFFPTPPAVIARVMEPYLKEFDKELRADLTKHRPWLKNRCWIPKDLYPVLDPSAGAGAFLEWIAEETDLDEWHKPDLYAIELDQELRHILQGKGFSVVGSDFLEYDEPVKYGLIVMNPPFKYGAEHVVHAWEFVRDGGHLSALVNSETVNNPCDRYRRLLSKLIDDYGHIEPLGKCFRDAERPTDVDVTLIRLHKPEREGPEFSFDDLNLDLETPLDSEEFRANPLAYSDPIRALVSRYNACRAILLRRWEEQRRLDFFLDGISYPVQVDASRSPSDADQSLRIRVNIEAQLAVLKSRFWNTVFEKTKMGVATTSGFKKTFEQFSAQQSKMAFTEANIREVFMAFFATRESAMEECILTTFDKATSYHENNRVHPEGWKTNSGYKVNKRVIIPGGVYWDSIMGHLRAKDSIQPFLDDLDKSLCWISGVNLEKGVNSWKTLDHFCWQESKANYQAPFESYFLKFRAFKKGTLHLDFKDLDLLARFNHAAAEGKNWIGGKGF